MLDKIKTWWKSPKGSSKWYKRGFDAGVERCEGDIASIRKYYMDIISNPQPTDKEQWLVDPSFVFGITKTGLITLNGEQITDRELKNLKSEVRALKEFEVFKVLQATLRQKAVEKALLGSTDLYSLKGNEQVLAGKMMIWSLDIIKTIVNDIDRAKTR